MIPKIATAENRIKNSFELARMLNAAPEFCMKIKSKNRFCGKFSILSIIWFDNFISNNIKNIVAIMKYANLLFFVTIILF